MLIGFYGKKQAGKSTSALYTRNKIRRIAGHTQTLIQVINFADTLKSVINTVFGVPLEILNGTDEEKNQTIIFNRQANCYDVLQNALNEEQRNRFSQGSTMMITARDLMQILGKVFRAINQNCFIESTLRRTKQADHTIIADVRMSNEMLAVLQAGGHIIYLDRNKDVISSEVSEQASLREIEECMHLIDNKENIHIINNCTLTTAERNRKLDTIIESFIFPIPNPDIGIYR